MDESSEDTPEVTISMPIPKIRKSGKMKAVEKKNRRDLEDLLPEMVNEFGMSDTATRLGLSKATLGYWLLKFQIRVERVALRPDEEIEIKRSRS